MIDPVSVDGEERTTNEDRVGGNVLFTADSALRDGSGEDRDGFRP